MTVMGESVHVVGSEAAAVMLAENNVGVPGDGL